MHLEGVVLEAVRVTLKEHVIQHQQRGESLCFLFCICQACGEWVRLHVCLSVCVFVWVCLFMCLFRFVFVWVWVWANLSGVPGKKTIAISGVDSPEE